jgi:hypothetical protein
MRIAFTLCLAIAAPCAAQDKDPADHTTVDTTLAEVRKTPDAFRGVKLTFPVQFAWIGKVSNPFFTQFVPSDFANMQAWGTEQPIWRRTEYDDVFLLLFLSKQNTQLSELFKIQRYERLQITGVVRNTFQGEPWIEVLTFTRQGAGVDTATLAHMYRGEQHMADRAWNRAISELTMSLRGSSPTEVQAHAHKNLGICYLRLGEAKSAVTHLTQASKLWAQEDPETTRLTTIAQSHPSLELDRQVRARAMDEGDRPLWEAFEDATKPTTPAPSH